MQSDGQVSPKHDHNSHMQDESKAADVPLNRREVLKYGFGGLAAVAATPLISKFVRTPSSSSKGSAMRRQPLSTSSVNLTLTLNGPPSQMQRLQSSLSQFYKQNPNISVTISNVTASYYTKIDTDGVAKTLPDVWYVRTFDTYFAYKGWTEPLNSYIAKDPSFGYKSFWPALQYQIKYDGNVYTLPENISCMVMYVNKTMFEKAGVPVPSPDWTWDDFLTTAAKFPITKSGGRQTRYAADLSNLAIDGLWVAEGIVAGNGGSLYSPDYRTATADSPENVKFFELVSELHARGFIPNGGAFPSGTNPFVAGLIAMSYDGDWQVSAFPSEIGTSFEWEILPLPIGYGGKRGISVAGGGYGVSAYSQHKQEAFELANFLTSTGNLEYRIADTLFSPPARSGAMPTYNKMAAAQKNGPTSGLDYIEQGVANGLVISYPPYNSPLSTPVTNRLQPIFDGADVKTQLKLLQQDTETLIKQYGL
jgi:multiple sugar transport system substrate-binding protein